MMEGEAMLAAISGGISNSGQDDDGGSAKVIDLEGDFWDDEDDEDDLWADLWNE